MSTIAPKYYVDDADQQQFEECVSQLLTHVMLLHIDPPAELVFRAGQILRGWLNVAAYHDANLQNPSLIGGLGHAALIASGALCR